MVHCMKNPPVVVGGAGVWERKKRTKKKELIGGCFKHGRGECSKVSNERTDNDRELTRLQNLHLTTQHTDISTTHRHTNGDTGTHARRCVRVVFDFWRSDRGILILEKQFFLNEFSENTPPLGPNLGEGLFIWIKILPKGAFFFPRSCSLHNSRCRFAEPFRETADILSRGAKCAKASWQ